MARASSSMRLSTPSNHLGAEQTSCLRSEDNLDCQRRGPGVIAGMGVGVDCGCQIRDVFLPEAFGGHSGCRHGQVEHLGYRRADRTFIFFLVTENHVVSGDPGLSVDRSGKIIHPGLAVDRMRKFYRVAHGVNVGRRSAEIFVDGNAAPDSCGESGSYCQSVERTHPDRKNHQIGFGFLP